MLKNMDDFFSFSSVVSELLLPMNPSFSAWKEFPGYIEKTLRIIGKLSRHNRIHIVDIHPDMTYSIAYEWCDDSGVKKRKGRREKVLYDPGLEKQLCEQNYMIIQENASSQNPDLHHFLQEQHCRQMLLLPLFEVGTNLTFIAFMQCDDIHTWNIEEIKLLENLSAVIGIQLDNYRLLVRLLKQLQQTKKEQESLGTMQTRLKQVEAAITSDWEQLREHLRDSEQLQQISAWQKIEKELKELNKICQTITVK